MFEDDGSCYDLGSGLSLDPDRDYDRDYDYDHKLGELRELSELSLTASAPAAPASASSASSAPPPPAPPAPARPSCTIPGLFARRSVNLLASVAFTGATRFILPQFNAYAAGLPFLNHPHPCPTAPEQLGMILCARDFDETWERLRDLDLDHLTHPGTFPIEKWSLALEDQSEPLHDFPLALPYQKLAERAGRPPRFILVESLQALAPAGKLNDPHSVIDFYNRLREFCQERDCTILGTVAMGKAKQGAGYDTLAERIYGSVQWGRGASSLIGIEQYSDTSSLRRITIQSKKASYRIPDLWADFDLQGRLLLCDPPANQEDKFDILTRLLHQFQPAEVRFTRGEAVAWGRTQSIGARTVDRWLQACLTNQQLRREGYTNKVMYWRPPAN